MEKIQTASNYRYIPLDIRFEIPGQAMISKFYKRVSDLTFPEASQKEKGWLCKTFLMQWICNGIDRVGNFWYRNIDQKDKKALEQKNYDLFWYKEVTKRTVYAFEGVGRFMFGYYIGKACGKYLDDIIQRTYGFKGISCEEILSYFGRTVGLILTPTSWKDENVGKLGFNLVCLVAANWLGNHLLLYATVAKFSVDATRTLSGALTGIIDRYSRMFVEGEYKRILQSIFFTSIFLYAAFQNNMFSFYFLEKVGAGFADTFSDLATWSAPLMDPSLEFLFTSWGGEWPFIMSVFPYCYDHSPIVLPAEQKMETKKVKKE